MRLSIMLAAVLACGFFFACLPLVTADDELDGKQIKKLESELKADAKRWWDKRKKMVGPCYHCKGAGVIRQIIAGRRGRVVTQTCPTCDGRKKWVYAEAYRELMYEARTPAYRLQKGIKDRLTREYTNANRGSPEWPTRIKTYRITRVEVIGATHGIIWTKQNRDRTERPQRWILAKDEAEFAWFLWTEGVDGPFPESPTEVVDPGPDDVPVEVVGPAPAETELAKRVEEAVNGVNMPWTARAVLVHAGEDALIVELKPKAGVDREQFDDAVKAAAVHVTRGVMASCKKHEALFVMWLDEYRDQLGNVEWKPRVITVMTQDLFERIVWNNLDADERFDLLDAEPQGHPGWKLWRGRDG